MTTEVLKVISREVVESTAHIIGPLSACAQALVAAEAMVDPVFLETSHASLVVVERSQITTLIEEPAQTFLPTS